MKDRRGLQIHFWIEDPVLIDVKAISQAILQKAACEKRKSVERRQKGERRDQYVRIDKWSSICAKAKEVCEVALLKHRQRPLNVHFTAKVAQDGLECRLMMVELTERRQTDSTQSAASCRRSQNLKKAGVMAMNI